MIKDRLNILLNISPVFCKDFIDIGDIIFYKFDLGAFVVPN